MKISNVKLVGRSASVLAIGVALTATGASAAGASSTNTHRSGDHATIAARDNARSGAFGYVSALTSTSVTIMEPNGSSATFTITPTTIVRQGATITTIASLAVGDRVYVQSANSSTTAVTITIALAHLMGTVSALNGDTITITSPQGFSRTVVVSSTTTFTLQGSPATLANVVVGSRIHATGVVASDGTTLDALSVLINPYRVKMSPEVVQGVITAVSSSSISVSESNGSVATFSITPATTLKGGSSSQSTANLMVGEHVRIVTSSSAPTLAMRINVTLDHLAGVVTAINGDVITLTSHHGEVQSVTVSSTTSFFEHNKSASLTSIAVGAHIRCEGVFDQSASTFDASSVSINSGPHIGVMTERYTRGDRKDYGARNSTRAEMRSRGWSMSQGVYTSVR